MLGIYARTSRDNPLEITSAIDQQIKAGIEFALKKGLDYKVYSDKGISGYKISEEEETDPFNNRPDFTKLINDIKNGNIESVWVWEHSRISRNQYASAYIFNIFQKYKITLYEKDKEFNLTDPTNQMLRQILDAVAQYERQLIVGRTTRGLYNAIDLGKRAHAKFFGYKRVGRDQNNNLLWEPVESEIEQLRNWYAQYKEGKSLRSIILNQIDGTDKTETQVLLQRATKLGRFLAHAEYTSYNLNMKGLEILHQFEKCEINNLQALKDKEYWVKSRAYTVEIISIKEWVDIRERLQQNKIIRANNDIKKRKAEKSLATGIIKCSCCGLYYYYNHLHYKKANKNEVKDYYYYYHHKSFGNDHCTNKPKSLDIKRIDSIFETFVYFYFLAFDKNKNALADDMNARQNEILRITEAQKTWTNEIAKIKKQIEKFNTAIDNTDDVKIITVLAQRINENQEKIKELTLKLSKSYTTLNQKNEELEKIQEDLVFYSASNRILNFHNKFNIEEKRTIILRTIDEAKIFNKHLLIRTANTVFLFNIKENYELPELAFDLLKNASNIKEVSDPFKNVANLNLNWRPYLAKNHKLKKIFLENNIKYDFDGYGIIF